MNADEVLEIESDHVVLATGAHWRRDGVGLFREQPIESLQQSTKLFTPDDIMAGKLPTGPTVVYDDDHYYMANVIAEKLCQQQIPVVFVTPESKVSTWGGMTSEQKQVQKRLIELGVTIITAHTLSGFAEGQVIIQCVYSGKSRQLDADSLVSVTSRVPDDALYQTLVSKKSASADNMPKSITRIGDCEAPAIIAGAIFSGHRYARELDEEVDVDARLKFDRVFFEER